MEWVSVGVWVWCGVVWWLLVEAPVVVKHDKTINQPKQKKKPSPPPKPKKARTHARTYRGAASAG